MSLTVKQWNKHKKAIVWLYKQPKGTKIWFKRDENSEWKLVRYPTWNENYKYVINDEYAELRKAVANGKTIQYFNAADNIWIDKKIKNPNIDFNSEIKYRIKPN